MIASRQKQGAYSSAKCSAHILKIDLECAIGQFDMKSCATKTD